MNKKFLLSDKFSYTLPPNRIALFPAESREESKLLVYRNKKIFDDVFKNIPCYVEKENILIVNDTKVIKARLLFRKTTGAEIEIFCLEPYEFNKEEKGISYWKCLVGNAKKWKGEILEREINVNNNIFRFNAELCSREKDCFIIKFRWTKPDLNIYDILNSTGEIPLPPYIDRKAEFDDEIRYQTVYAKKYGSVAAPTAGLHFTPEIIKRILQNGIDVLNVTLDVSLGTFKPVTEKNLFDYEIHSEKFRFSELFLQTLINNINKKIVAVGTTTTRVLETIYWMGYKLVAEGKLNTNLKQWEVYNLKDSGIIHKELILNEFLKFMKRENLSEINAATALMIIPGYDFKITDVLITNFHLPKSSLLMLVAAFIGNEWKNVYNHALENNYRFLSYGDTSILFKC
ncbi:MAG: S-adenosylmethionine:tRNA ribosyltransferase-isomerase [Ignavibacteria bacterium]|nr:S-adenosylmethionine:tRNA ribosyltransferase-isomerase [Ignavibacteria bacterium]